ncbi:MAG: DUF4097 family beta strand repeat-containing protein [Acidobacteriota bacterium]
MNATPRISRYAALLAVPILFAVVAQAAQADDLGRRSFRVQLPASAGDQPIRLANLAGRIEIVPGTADPMSIETTVYAQGKDGVETQDLLQRVKWVKGRDAKGREEWALSYPVDTYRGFHYPSSKNTDDDVPSFLSGMFDGATSTLYRGEKVRVYGSRRSGIPTLYANVRIAMPPSAKIYVRNVVGPVDGANLSGDLVIDTGCGDVKIASFDGHLVIDTGSGDVKVGTARGESSIDTGSGDVVVAHLIGNSAIDTGSGDVRVEGVSAGKLAIDTGSGDVSVKNGAAGRLVADTGSGSVEVLGVELEELVAETGSGDVSVHSSLAKTRKMSIETGSGEVSIKGGQSASFDISSDQGSGRLNVGYSDAVLRKDGHKVIGAKRLNGQTAIHVETGSGDCTISPNQM